MLITSKGLRKFFFILVPWINHSTVFSQQVSDKIMVNQQGYYPGAPKIAVLTGGATSNTFYVTTTNLRDTIFSGKLSEERRSMYSTTVTKIADFSSLRIKGSYVMVIPGSGNSYVFRVDDNVHRQVAIAAIKGFYYQRASMPLQFKYAGKWQRSGGHPDTAVLI